jgi:hypothetical protein
MVLGMSLSTFTLLHVIISLIGILSGFVVLFDMYGSKVRPGWTRIFLISTILTSVTGFFFPFTKLLPSHIVGIISLFILAVALLALYRSNLAGHARWIYVATAVAALYLNVFVLAVQAFLKIPALKSLAPTQSEPPFAIAQGVVLIVFIGLFIGAVRSFRPAVRSA